MIPDLVYGSRDDSRSIDTSFFAIFAISRPRRVNATGAGVVVWTSPITSPAPVRTLVPGPGQKIVPGRSLLVNLAIACLAVTPAIIARSTVTGLMVLGALDNVSWRYFRSPDFISLGYVSVMRRYLSSSFIRGKLGVVDMKVTAVFPLEDACLIAVA